MINLSKVGISNLINVSDLQLIKEYFWIISMALDKIVTDNFFRHKSWLLLKLSLILLWNFSRRIVCGKKAEVYGGECNLYTRRDSEKVSQSTTKW